MRKKSLALLLVLVMLLGLAAPTALAEEPEDPALTAEELVQQEEVTVTETVDTSDAGLPDNDELFAGYVDQMLYPSRGGVSLLANWGSSTGVLNDNERAIYNQLKGKIESVAADGGSTKFTLDVSSLNITWTGGEDGYKAILNTSKIIDCLLVDCPYELYWYDKTVGAGWGIRYSQGSTYKLTSLTATLYVAQGYQSGNNTTVNASKVTAAKTAADNAQAIVNKYAGKSDYEKLKGYKDEICALVDYNDDAADKDYTGGYGDPWQIIYVFDEDSTTNVVCEGYAKAFQYLCDLSTFDNAVCYTVNGTMSGGTGAGGHMWNIVTLDGENYLVDVTNCDEGTVGYPDDLFLKAASGSVDGGYTVHGVKYAYDPDMISLYGSGILTLSDSDYDPPAKVTDLTATATYNGTTSHELTIDVPTKGNTVEVTLTAEATYDNGSTGEVDAEWEFFNGPYYGVSLSDNTLTITPAAGSYAPIYIVASYGGQASNNIFIYLKKEAPHAGSIEISGPASVTIPTSGSTEAGYTATMENQYGEGYYGQVTWEISGPNGVSVDKDTGVVTVTHQATANTTATLTATCDGVSEEFKINIINKPDAEVTITGVPEEAVVYTGAEQSIPLTATNTHNTGTGIGFDRTWDWEWSTSDQNVLVPGGNGSNTTRSDTDITVVGPGIATITATYEDDGYYGQNSVTITVLGVPTEDDFTVTWPESLVYDGTKKKAAVTVKDGITGMGEYTVLYDGSPTAPTDAGTYDVTLQVEKGDKYTDADLGLGSFTIAKATPAITVNSKLEVTKNTTQSLNATISNKGTLTYRSNNTSVATVDEKGIVTGVKEGTATITISYAGDSNYNAVSKTVTVEVIGKTLVDVTFTSKGNQTYNPDGYALGEQFSAATAANTAAGGTISYIYDGTTYGTLTELPKVVDAGTYTVTAVYNSDIEYGTMDATFTIAPKEFSTSTNVTLNANTVTYTGNQADVSVTGVMMDGYTLEDSVDYTVSVPQAIDVGTYTVTVTGQGNYTGTATADFTITKAEASAAMTTVSADARYGTAGTVALDLAGGTAGTIAVSDASKVLSGTPTLSNGVLSFVFVDSEANVDKTATITIPVTGATNYKDYTITVTVTVTNKLTPTLTVSPITVTYTGKTVSDGSIRGTATYDGKTVSGTWSWTGGNAPTTVAQSGPYSVTFTPDDTETYTTNTATVQVTINKATPAGAPGYTAITTSGKTLADAKLTIGSFTVKGSIKWADDASTVVKANTDYKWIFTPDDTNNYNPATGAIELWHRSSSGSSSGGSSSSGSSGGKTETEKNPDGSTTTTVTSSNGTVTETTKYPDGSKEVVETKKDGTVTTTSTDKTGNETKVVENPNGSSKTTVDNKDGSSSTTTVSRSGHVEAEVNLPVKVIEEAAEAGEAVALPMPELPVTSDRDEAPTVTMNLAGGRSAKVEIPVDRVTPGTVAILVKADGTEQIVKTSVTTDNGVAVTLSDGDTVKVVDNSKNFTDVSGSYWAADAIDFATSRELFAGNTETTFNPGGTMTRAMIWTVLARYDGTDTTNTTGGVGYTAGQTWAMDNGISDGTNANGTMTREQLATMLYRYAQSKGQGFTGAWTFQLDYPDAERVSSYAYEALCWMTMNGVIGGMTDGTLNPQGSATRAQVATILQRYVEVVNG